MCPEKKIKDPLNKVKWQTVKPILDKSSGECWLFHGTNCANLITQNGFTAKFKAKDKYFGYGALGKGIYLTDIFSKSSIYVNCPKCQQSHCKCNKREEKELKEYKTILLSRVLLGDAYIERNNSVIDMIQKKDNKRYWNGPPRDFNSVWAPSKKLSVSDFDSNEFCVPENQVYPEFCIFYEENSFVSNNSGLFIDTDAWNKNYKQHLKQYKFFEELSKAIEDYERLVSLKRINFIDQTLRPLVKKCIEVIKHDQHKIYLIEIHSKLTLEYEKLTEKQKTKDENKIEIEIKANSYFNSGEWFKAILCINQLPDQSAKYFLMRGKCYYELKQFESYIKDINTSIESNPEFQISEAEFERFMRTSLVCLLNDYEIFSKKDYFLQLIQKIVDWLNKYDSETKTEIWRMILINNGLAFKSSDDQNTSKEEIESKIEKLLDQDDLAYELSYLTMNEKGTRQSTIENEKIWHLKLKSLISNDKNKIHVEMSWLNEQSEIEKGYLLEEYADFLFDSQTGLPKIDQPEPKGKKLVKLLKKDNKRLAYFKFYPDYPLRQQAVDELCKRLSGFSSINTLVKLKHSLRSECHPVLVSEPLGIESKTTLDDWERDISEFEKNLDSFLFSWKFIETYLIQPRDDKGDNLSVNKKNKKYYLVSVDSDLSFGYKFNCNLKEPDVYSLVYLSESMKKNIHPAVVKLFSSDKSIRLIR